MAQLEQDEWPKDDEPTTAEEERGEFKREGPNPPGKKTGQTDEATNRLPDESVIRKVNHFNF